MTVRIIRGLRVGPGELLEHADLSGADLQDVDLTGAMLSFANLKGARLSNANLKDAELSNADLSHANLSYANFYNATLHQAKFVYADLTGAYLRADAVAANFTCADLTRADLSYGDFTCAIFRDAELRGASLKFATLTEANFTGANLRGANLFEAYLERARFPGADLKGAILPTVIQNSAGITFDQIASADGTLVGTEGGSPVKSFLSAIDFKIDIEVRETKENRDKITARLDQLSSDVASLAGITKETTPAKTVLAAIEASDLTPQIMELVSDAVLDCADME